MEEQRAWVIGVGTVPGSEELEGYYYLTSHPEGTRGLHVFCTKEGAEKFIEKHIRNNPEAYMAMLANIFSDVAALGTALTRGEFRVRPVRQEELPTIMAELGMDYLV